MATSRLTFLYPHLFRTGGRWSEHAASNAGRSSRRKPSPLTPSPACCQPAAPFTTPSAGRQAGFAKRAGKGVEPLAFQEPPKTQPNSEGRKPGGKDEAKGTAQATQTPPASTPRDGSQQQPSPPAPDLPPTIELPPPGDINPTTQVKKGTPMDEILHMGPPPDSLSPPPSTTPPSSADAPTPSSSKSADTTTTTTTGGSSTSTTPTATTDTGRSPDKTPHLKPPQYVHHFDSYTLVKQLTAGGYTLPQAILAMKAIRTILASNLDAAQSGLVSKADVENETYLFRAACSELSAEVHNNRRVADEQLRQQRTLLQHEVDILAQRLNQELLTLNDSVRGMFNDRRMAVREEQKAVESRIQQINYKISVMLTSDSKSNIEGLRWVLIRRSAIGIIFMVIFTLGTIRYATFMAHKRQKEADQQAREEQELKKHDGRADITPAPDAAEILAAN